ncbi:hypothetical protein [Hymenobacter sp. B81]|uniref:hypothetical protein n=1 Tax=Hymenobacter sp. B81 TaxID=3344878 RepID=UPI0037DC990E
MKKNSTAVRRQLLPDGATLSLKCLGAGDLLSVRCATTGVLLPPVPLLGYARTPDGLSLYVAGHTGSALRLATEHAPDFVREVFFGPAPTHLTELAVEDYADGDLVRYPRRTAQYLRAA